MIIEIISVLIYFVLAMVLCFIGYKLFDMITPYDLQKELDDHNLGAGFAVAGMFIGIAIIIGGVILP